MPCDDLDDTLLRDDIVIIVSGKTLVDTMDDQFDSYSKINLSPPSIVTRVKIYYHVIGVIKY